MMGSYVDSSEETGASRAILGNHDAQCIKTLRCEAVAVGTLLLEAKGAQESARVLSKAGGGRHDCVSVP